MPAIQLIQAEPHRELMALQRPEPALESVASNPLSLTVPKMTRKDANGSPCGVDCDLQIFPLYSVAHRTNPFDHKATMQCTAISYIQHPFEAKQHNIDVDLDNRGVPH